jgi:hypothetical protein
MCDSTWATSGSEAAEFEQVADRIFRSQLYSQLEAILAVIVIITIIGVGVGVGVVVIIIIMNANRRRTLGPVLWKFSLEDAAGLSILVLLGLCRVCRLEAIEDNPLTRLALG